jgi:hypothetical protein
MEKKIGVFLLKTLFNYEKLDQNIDFLVTRLFFRRKLVENRRK